MKHIDIAWFRRSHVTRCGITFAAITVLFAGSTFLNLPGLEARLAFVLHQGAWSWAAGSVFTLGATSYFVSALAVDLWRRVRPSMGHRKHLTKTVIVVAMLLAVLLAYHSIRSFDKVVALPLMTKAVWLLMLVAGQGVLAALAWWISHRGIGQGFAIFSTLGIVDELQDLLMRIGGTGTPALSFNEVVQIVGIPFLVVLITILILRVRISNSERIAWIARVPVGGIGPVIVAFALPMLVTLFALFGYVDARQAVAMTPGSPTFTVVASIFTVIMTIALGYVNHSFVAGASGPGLRRAFWQSMPVTLLFALVFVWRPALVDQTVVDPLSVVIATAVCMDLCAEFAGRATHGEMVVVAREVDVAMADFTASALRRANVAVVQRGVFFATVTRFFGALVPIEIMVPTNRAPKAIGVIHENQVRSDGAIKLDTAVMSVSR